MSQATPAKGRRGARKGALDSVEVPKASLELENYASSDVPSVMFPRARRGSDPAPSSAGQLRTVPQHLPRRSASVMSDADTMTRGMRAYGGDEDARSLKSNHMAGSRPASTRNGRAPTASKFSVLSGGTTDGAAQYLYLHEPSARSSRPTVVGSSRSVNKQGLAVPPPANGTTSVHGSVIDENEERSPTMAATGLPTVITPAAEKIPEGPLEPIELGPQHAWYLLRTLVGLEVSNEAGKLHRLTNFSPELRPSPPRGFEDNHLDYGGESEVGAREMPILRYIIKHFLLTLPFIRDVTPQSIDITGGRIDDTFDDSDTPYYWRGGVLPILRALHAADLSQPVDAGRRSLGSIMFGIYGSHAMERFVSSGLRLSNTATDAARAPSSVGVRAMSPARSRNENPFTRSMAASPTGRRSKQGFSGLFRPRGTNRDSIADSPDLAGPKPPGHLEPVANELSSDVDSDEEHEDTAAENRRKAEEALAGGAVAGAAAEAVATPKTPARQRDGSVSSKKSHTPTHQRRESEAVSAAETDDTSDMQTAENGDVTGSSPVHDGRPSEASTIGQSSHSSAVTASEGDLTAPSQESEGVTPTGEGAKAGIISSVVGYFTGTSAIDPPPATSTPKRSMEVANRENAEDEADKTLRAPETDTETASVDTAVPPLPGAILSPYDKQAGPLSDADGYEVPDAPSADVANKGVGMLWTGKAPNSPSQGRRALDETDEDAKPLSPSKRPPRTSSRVDSKRAPEDKAEEAKRRKETLAAVAATGVDVPKDKKRGFSISSFASSMRKGKSAPQGDKVDGPSTSDKRRKPSEVDRDWYAPLNLPGSLQQRSSTPGGHDSTIMPDVSVMNDNGHQDYAIPEVAGHEWPWGAPVPFWKGTPVHRVAWGGFEADVVGVRKTFAGHAYIIRVRRPQRLDEFVLRDESQFKKYLGILDKQYPHAHLRSIPEGKISRIDDAVDPTALAGVLLDKHASKEEKRKTNNSFMRPISFSRSASARDLSNRSEVDVPQSAVSDDEGDRRKSVDRKSSRLSMRLKKAASFYGDDRSNRLSKSAPGSRRGTISTSPAANRLPAGIAEGDDLPYLDAQRRALRNWLRDTLSVRTVGHNRETAAFLLLGSVRLKEPEHQDIRLREMIDESRRRGRVGVAQGAADRGKQAHETYNSVMQEIIFGDGLLALSEAIRDCPRADQLPPRFQKALEWSRFSTAQMLHDLLVAGEHSGPLFLKLKRLNASMPWFLLRQTFKLPNVGLMTKGLQDVLLNGRFGKQSMLNKALAAILDDDPRTLNDQIEAARARIQSNGICEKLTRFVYASRETKDLIRRHAAEHNMELVVTIARGADEPRLDRYDLERVVRAAKVYKSFMKRNPTPSAKVKTENGSVRLILDMQIFLRLLSRERDAHEVRGILANDATTQAFQVLVAPLMEFFKRAYRGADMSRFISDLQKFLDQLIVIIDALRSRIQDPQKAVRIIARLLSRHTQSFYSFVHSLHREDTVIEELFQWMWTATTFLRRGLAKQVDLEAVVPQTASDRRFLLEELDAIVEYHKRKRTRQYELMCRRFAGDIDSDDPVIVEGDGMGKSRLEPLIETEPRVPRLFEIPRVGEAFRAVLVDIFSV